MDGGAAEPKNKNARKKTGRLGKKAEKLKEKAV